MTHLRRIAGLALVLLLAGVAGADAQSVGTGNHEIQRFTLPGGNTTGWRIHDNGTTVNLTLPVGAVFFTGVTFANLGTVDLGPGTLIYCTDCNKATPCAGSSTGAWAKRRTNQWDCD